MRAILNIVDQRISYIPKGEVTTDRKFFFAAERQSQFPLNRVSRRKGSPKTGRKQAFNAGSQPEAIVNIRAALGAGENGREEVVTSSGHRPCDRYSTSDAVFPREPVPTRWQLVPTFCRDLLERKALGRSKRSYAINRWQNFPFPSGIK